MTELLKEDHEWRWTDEHEKLFDKSKEAYLKEVVVNFPDFTKPLFLNTDVSKVAIGGELIKLNDEDQ